MADWTLQHASEIIDGPTYLIHANHLTDNFSGLNSSILDRLNINTASAQTVVGAITWSAAQTFTSGLLTNLITERTGGNGVQIAGTTSLLKVDQLTPVSTTGLIINSAFRANVAGSPVTLYEGQIWYDSTNHVPRIKTNATTTLSLQTGWPTGRHGSAAPVYVSANTFTVAYIREKDSTDVYNLVKSTSTTVDISTTGLNGRDAGSDSSSTWYFLYAIGKTTGTTGLILSTVNETVSGSITLPSGYTLKRQLAFAVRNDGSANFIPWVVADGWPYRPRIMYDTSFYRKSASASTTEVLAGGAATSYTAQSLAAFVPPISRQSLLWASTDAGNYLQLRATSGTAEKQYGFATDLVQANIHQTTDSSQSIDYLVSGNTTDLAVMGYVVDQVA